jgi:membrane protein YdbS with pleckstrin-like domain
MIAPMRVRQSVKMVLAAYIACGLVEALLILYWLMANPRPAPMYWALLLIPIVGQVMAAKRHVEKLSSVLTVNDGRIRYESGMLSRTTRTLELGKIQDVRVEQTPFQRVLNLGDLSLETAGESGRLTMSSIDKPQEIADQLLDLARKSH